MAKKCIGLIASIWTLFVSGAGVMQQPLRFGLLDSIAPHIIDSVALRRPALFELRYRFWSIAIPAGSVAYGFGALGNNAIRHLNSTTKAELREDHPAFTTHADNYLQFAPVVAVYSLDMIGIKGKHDLRGRTVLYGLSAMLSSAVVFPLKKITHEQRPDHSNYGSFPSGHTAMAFASAEFLRQEYKDVSAWYGVAGYALAATTGALRMYNNKHWLSDVIAGAGFGMLSTRAAYWVYPWIRRRILGGKQMTAFDMVY